MKPNRAIPKISITTESGSVIANNLGEPVSKFFTGFVYEYDETGDDDLCTITFALNNQNLHIIDHPSLSIDSVIKVRWGYLNGDMSAYRTVAIRDYESRYDSSGITHILKCSDLVSYLKTTQTGGSVEQLTEFAEYLKNLCKDRITIVTEAEVTPEPGSLNGFMDVYDRDVLGLNERLALPDQTQIRLQYLKKFAVVYPSIKSDYHNVKDMVESAEGDNTINGRDDELIIKKNIKANQSVYKAYGVANQLGEDVLEFMPESKFKNNDVDLDQDVSIDPETGDIIVKGGSSISSDQANDLEVREVVRKAAERDASNNTLWLDRIAPAPYVELQNFKYKQGDPDESPRDKAVKIADDFIETVREASKLTSESTTGDIYVLGDEQNMFNSNKVISKPIPVSVLLKSPRVKEELSHMAQNIIARKEYDKRKMVLRLVGDPKLQSDYSIYINGAASKHNGKYYLQKVTHRIDSHGFTTLAEGIKVSINTAGLKQILTKIEETQAYESIEEYYRTIEKYLEVEEVEYGPSNFKQGQGAEIIENQPNQSTPYVPAAVRAANAKKSTYVEKTPEES